MKRSFLNTVILATLAGLTLSTLAGCAGFNMARFERSLQPEYRQPVPHLADGPRPASDRQ
jgi:hypothetical protein